MERKEYRWHTRQSLLMLLLVLVAVGCGPKKQSSMGASGRPLDLVVVLPDAYDSPALRDSVKKAFGFPLPILPQPEPILDVMFTTHNNFTSMFRAMRNIVYVSIDPTMYTGPSVSVSRDDYAAGQMMIHAKADTETSFYKLLRVRAQMLGEMIYQEEIKRRQPELEVTYSSAFAQLALDSVGKVTINAPVELEFLNTGKNFVWSSNMAREKRMDFVVYSFPYRDTNTFTLEYLVHKRDSVLGANIKGQYPNSYMTTEKRLMPQMRVLNYNGIYRAELRGLWVMENDMMGGPFVMHAILDEDNANVLVAEAFVYNPSGKKRNLMLFDEAALYTLRRKGADFTTHLLPTEEQNDEQ